MTTLKSLFSFNSTLDAHNHPIIIPSVTLVLPQCFLITTAVTTIPQFLGNPLLSSRLLISRAFLSRA